MMDDDFMRTGLRTPRPALMMEVRARLRRLDAADRGNERRRMVFRPLAYAASVLLLIGALTFPTVRAEVQEFLDLFRVVNFAAVPVQTDRAQSLVAKNGLDLPRLVGEQMQMVRAPSAPQGVATPQAAEALAGVRVRPPTWLPAGLQRQQIEVTGDQRWTITASAVKLQRVLAAFGIDDIAVPEGLDGQVATVVVPPVVQIHYGEGADRVLFIQARQPEASFPVHLDLPRLAEIGLRVLGLERADARRFAQNVDWRTTLVVPVLADVSRVHQVDIGGRAGLLIETTRKSPAGPSPSESRLLWSSGDSVFALVGNLRPEELFEMAQSVER